ncbi:MAG: hypothetical protein ACMXYL_04870 [Candidatus Woesearchaeota archaeon]
MKCSLCKSDIPTTILGKIVGTYVKDENGRRKPVCSQCQKKSQ